MNKLIFVLLIIVTLSACSYNPVDYEQQRKSDNEAHDHQNGI